MQGWVPYHKAIDEKKFGNGDQFNFETGVQHHTYTKDLFVLDEERPMPACPALRLREDLDGTATPSFEGLSEVKPQVSK